MLEETQDSGDRKIQRIMDRQRRRNYRRNRYVDKKGVFKPGNKFQTGEGDWPMQPQGETLLLGANDYRDLFISRFIDERIKEGKSTVTDKMTVRGTHKEVTAFVRETLTPMSEIMFSSGTNNVLIKLSDAIVETYTSSNTVDFTFHASFDRIDEIKDIIREHFEEINVYISWVYDSHGSTATVPIDNALLPVDEMYPFLGDESLDSYYNRFMKSSASILILIGPPGGGKTSFIRGYLSATESSALVTYDQKILERDTIFSAFIDGNSPVLVIEDADLFLSSRKEGNEMMHKFLNVGDGLVTVKGKKMIFSTNLPSIKDIDEALLRPGRCFDILHFDNLNREQAERLTSKLNLGYNFTDAKDEFSVAELFSGTKNSATKSPKTGFGFVPG